MGFKIRFLGHIGVVIMDYNLVDIRKTTWVGQQIRASGHNEAPGRSPTPWLSEFKLSFK
jgi:hypothetical protein